MASSLLFCSFFLVCLVDGVIGLAEGHASATVVAVAAGLIMGGIGRAVEGFS